MLVYLSHQYISIQKDLDNMYIYIYIYYIIK